MKNLLIDTLTESEVAGLFLAATSPIPSLGTDTWKQISHNPLARTLFLPVLERGRHEWEQPLPLLTDTLYADYNLTGSRLPFENVYFLRRRMLARAAMGLLLSEKHEQSAWQASLVSKLSDVADETSWALTAHVTATSGKDPLTLDLFAAETANLMGEMITVFGQALPEPLIQQIRTRLRETIFQNYLEHHQNLWWTQTTNNWNAVCHQGILGAVLSSGEDPALIARMLLTARAHLPHFLEGFGPDGGCSEGPGYWQYGFGWFSLLNEQLETASGRALSLFEGDPHVHEIALFYPRATFSNGYLVNFADGLARSSVNPRLLRSLGERLDDDLLRAYGDNAWRALLQTGLDLEGQRCDFLYLARLLRDCPTALPAETVLPRSDFFFSDLHVLTAHRQDDQHNLWEFAAKGGHNEEHHNHNDCGSFLLHVNGQPFVTEIGAPEYRKEFFSARRYENLAARARGHSVPLVNGQEQEAGRTFAARTLSHELTADTVRIVVDLTQCYPAAAHCRQLIRTFVLNLAAGTLTVTDDYEMSQAGPFETAVITHQSLQDADGGPMIVSGTGRLALRPLPGTQVAAMTEHAYRDHTGADASIRRIALTPILPAASGSIGYCFSLDGQSTDRSQ